MEDSFCCNINASDISRFFKPFEIGNFFVAFYISFNMQIT